MRIFGRCAISGRVRCRYINLEQAHGRREALEGGFARLAPADWSLDRFTALDGATLPGTLTPAERGCFASHRELLRSEPDPLRPVLVLEDDTVLSPALFLALPDVLNALGEWDLLFMEAAVGDANGMASLALKRQHFTRSGHLSIMDLARIPLSSSSAYLVNGQAKARLLALLDAHDQLDVPYDLFLRRRIAEGALKAYVVVPYLTTISGAASQIAARPFEGAVALFRQTMFVERDDEACERAAAALSEGLCSVEARLVGTACAGVLDALSRES